MIGFRVSLNGGSPLTMGLLKGVATLMVTIRPPREDDEVAIPEVSYDAGGLDSATDEFLTWVQQGPLQPGDRLTLEVVHTDRVDASTRRPTNSPPPGWDEGQEDQSKDEDDEEPFDPEAAREKMEKAVEVCTRPGAYQPNRPDEPVLALKVAINGRKKIVAGVKEGVASLIAAFQYPAFGESKESQTWNCDLSLGGLDPVARRHFYWLRRDLMVGDEISIEVTRTTEITGEIEPYEGFPKRINRAPIR